MAWACTGENWCASPTGGKEVNGRELLLILGVELMANLYERLTGPKSQGEKGNTSAAR